MHNASNISFHTGELEQDARRWHSEGFHRMLENMNAGGFAYGDLGYGFLGTGVYHTTDVEDLIIDGKIMKYGYAINCNPKRYNLYSPSPQNTDSFVKFMSRFQGYIIHEAIRNEEWDNTLKNINIETLYDEYKNLFVGNRWNHGEFKIKTIEYINTVKAACRENQPKENILFKSEFSHADNISTRFLKAHGYHGVDLRHTSYDNVEHGSVIFDLNKKDIITRFTSCKEMVAFAKKITEMEKLGLEEKKKKLRADTHSLMNFAGDANPNSTGQKNTLTCHINQVAAEGNKRYQL